MASRTSTAPSRHRHTHSSATTAESLERRTRTGDALALIRDMIVLGELPPGQPLRLEELARTLDMSASPIREALRQLEMIGLVSHSPYRGAAVTRLSIDEMTSVYETRLAIETLVVRRLADCFDADVDAKLTEILAGIEASYRSDDRLGVVRGNTLFHIAMAANCGSPWLERLVRQTHDVWERYSAALIPPDESHNTYEAEARGHSEILAALTAHDAEAAEQALRQHLTVSRTIFERTASPLRLDAPPYEARIAARVIGVD